MGCGAQALASALITKKIFSAKKEPTGTTDEDIYAAKKMYESAFHPETQQKMFLPGRMSFQVRLILSKGGMRVKRLLYFQMVKMKSCR